MATATTARRSRPANGPELKLKWAGRIPHLKPGKYADGMPLHQVEYLACKLILKPNKFTSRQSLFNFAKVLRPPADECDVGFSTAGFDGAPLKIREVLFIDTRDFRLYNNAFILRRRIPYTEGFPSGEPEIVFKYRHPDIQKAAETDVRPHILGDHRVKFKCQALPLKDQLGGIRMLYSHNVQFPRSHIGGVGAVVEFPMVAKVFPVLDRLKHGPHEKIQLVNNAIVEEVLQDIGMLDFGSGIKAKTNVRSGVRGENTGR
jgi:hypothetical protein